jgi:hypothetical protein
MRYSVAPVAGCARADSAQTATISEAKTARTAAVENMWMNGGKLVDILTCRGFFFAHCSGLPPRAACGCAFAGPFACATLAGCGECSAGLTPALPFSLRIALHAAHRSSLRGNHQWPRIPYRGVPRGTRPVARRDRSRALRRAGADAVLRANTRRGRTSAQSMAEPRPWPARVSGISTENHATGHDDRGRRRPQG